MKHIWVNDSVMEFYVTHEEALMYFRYEWEEGRLRDNCKYCEKEFNLHHCRNHEARCCAKLFRKLRNAYTKNKLKRGK